MTNYCYYCIFFRIVTVVVFLSFCTIQTNGSSSTTEFVANNAPTTTTDIIHTTTNTENETPQNHQHKQHKLPTALNLTIHENLLTPTECKTLTNFAKPFLRPSKVGRPAKIQPTLRLAYSCKIPRLPHPTLWSIEHKLASAAGVPIERGEDLQVGGYPIGHYYGMHCDERRGGRPGGGGRLATALAYLNDLDGTLVGGGYTVFSGEKMVLPGGVDFPRSDVRVRELKRLSGTDSGSAGGGEEEEDSSISTRVSPKQGRVITFRNLVATPNNDGDAAHGAYRFIDESTHGASPVTSLIDPPPPEGTKGTIKYVVQQWFGLANEVNISRHPSLISHLGLGVADNYGVHPMMDLASATGEPRGVVTGSGGGGGRDAVVEKVPSLIPGIGATRIKGWCASVESKGVLPIPSTAATTVAAVTEGTSGLTTTTTDTNGPIAAGIWFLLNDIEDTTSSSNGSGVEIHQPSLLSFDPNILVGNNNDNTNDITNNGGDRRIFRVGPHEISVSQRGEIIWSVGGKSTRSVVDRILPKRWYHLALAVDSPYRDEDSSSSNSSKNGKKSTIRLQAEIGISIPGQAPSKPLGMEITGLDGMPEWIEGVSVGGCTIDDTKTTTAGEDKGGAVVDITVTDFYAVREDMKGKGHSFAFAIVYYDPGQGI